MAGNPGTNVHPRRNRMSRRVVSRPHSPSTPDTRHLSFWPTPCCHPTMVDANPHLRRLSPQDWEFLFRETLLFAHYQVQRLRWRGSYGGIMPDGFDPNSLAAHSISATAKICLREAVDRLVQFYEATERPGEAALWKQKLLEFDRER